MKLAGVLTGLLLIALGGWVFMPELAEIQERRSSKAWEETEASVTLAQGDVRPAGRTIHHFTRVRYRFAAGPDTLEREIRLPAASARAAHQKAERFLAEKLVVLYLQNDPERHRLLRDTRGESLTTILLALLCAGTGTVILLRSLRRKARFDWDPKQYGPRDPWEEEPEIGDAEAPSGKREEG